MARRLSSTVGLALVVLVGCTTYDDARILQVINQRGFGRPTLDANRQYYIGIDDVIRLRDSMHVEYNGIVEQVRMDGVVTMPDVGEVYVNGLTPQQCTEAIRTRYAEYVTDTSAMQVDVLNIQSKRYYIVGVIPKKAAAVPFRGDELLIDVLIRTPVDPIMVNTDKILVIRGDPENPLLIPCSYDDIVEEGITRDNIAIRENDIVFLTPSIIGHITQVVNAVLAPLKPLQQLIFGSSAIIATTDSFGQQKFGKGNKFNNF